MISFFRKGIKEASRRPLFILKGVYFGEKRAQNKPDAGFEPIIRPEVLSFSFLGSLKKKTGLDLEQSIRDLENDEMKQFLSLRKNIMPFLITSGNLQSVGLK